MNHHKYLSLLVLTFLLALTLLPSSISADSIVGETVVTLGSDLTLPQQTAILQEMNVSPNTPAVQILYVSNQEEYQYLGNYMSRATIGFHAISSTKITITPAGSGLTVRTHNITTITPAMYANAAITAGLHDANIYVTAPFPVSGTAGLTGIIKAYQAATGVTINENTKQVANEEMVRTQQLAGQINDPTKAVQMMNSIKASVAQQAPGAATDYQNIVQQAGSQYNVSLSPQAASQLAQFAKSYAGINPTKGQVSQLHVDTNNTIAKTHEEGLFDSIASWFSDLFQAIGDFFTGSSSTK